jgi:hypothetical protein
MARRPKRARVQSPKPLKPVRAPERGEPQLRERVIGTDENTHLDRGGTPLVHAMAREARKREWTQTSDAIGAARSASSRVRSEE